MNNIKRLRIAKNLTQKQLSKKLPVALRTVSNWEQELRSPNSIQRKRLCEVLECAEAELFGEIETKFIEERIPVISWARGGEDDIDVKPISRIAGKHVEFRNCKAIEILGDSMHPIAYQGQKIIYNDSKMINNGDLVYIGLKNGSQLFKRYYKDIKNNLITLQPINVANHHGPRNIQEKEIDFIHKVVGVCFE